MTIYIKNPDVPSTDPQIIADIQAYMVGKHEVTGANLVANVAALQGMPRNQQEQAVIDSGMTYEDR